MTKKQNNNKKTFNMSSTWREREKRMHGGIWVIEERERERERNRGAWDKSGIVSFK